jgi:hypothetical protein
MIASVTDVSDSESDQDVSVGYNVDNPLQLYYPEALAASD